MKLFKSMKDGGPLSRVYGFFLIEAKSLFSVAVLRFSDGSRDAYHTHAFNAVSWVLRGKLVEKDINGESEVHTPSIKPIFTPREKFHQVVSVGNTWALTFRGPWAAEWKEYLPSENSFLTLAHGRKRVS